MTRFARLAALLTLGVATRAEAQPSVSVEGPPRAKAAIIVRNALADAPDVMLADSSQRLVLPRGAEVPRTVLILGGDASVGATVKGDVIVVGGDLFLRPGALIEGRTIAIGGGVYGSTLASVKGGIESLRDHTFEVTRSQDGIRLDYRYVGAREPGFELPVMEGLRIPSYDRVDGASIAWGPILRPTVRWVVDPTVTYRSHLGEWDPGVNAAFRLGERYTTTLDARRGTFTNDAWFHSTIINSLNTLWSGSDVRNYYRADRVELELRRFDDYVDPKLELHRYVALVTERSWSVGSPDTLGGRPWSFTGRTDPDKLARGNPPIAPGRISSAVLGAFARYQLADIRMSGTIEVEVPWQSPGNERFAQATFDGTIGFPTFGVQRFRSDLHVVVTVGDSAPPQRFAYLGGSGTLSTIDDPLSLGGDQLLLLDSRYEVPLPRFTVPLLGFPTFAVRHRIGSAGVHHLPRFVQNVGPLLTLSFARLEYTIDPATGDDRFKLGLSFVR